MKSLLIGILALVGLGVLGNALLAGGNADAHGGDASVLHLCVGKWGSLKAAYVVSPNTNCPGALFDQVHLAIAGPAAPSIALPQSCPAGQYVNGIAADGSITCAPALSVVVRTFSHSALAGEGSVGFADCLEGEIATGGGVEISGESNPDAVRVVTTTPRPNPSGTTNPTGWWGGIFNNSTTTAQFTIYVVCAPVG